LFKSFFQSKHTRTTKMAAASFLVSPLTEALYGDKLTVDDNKLKINKNEVIDIEIRNKNVLNRLFQRLLKEVKIKRGGDVFDEEDDKDVLYEAIKNNVMTCRMFSSRFVGRCYITNKNYGENCPELHGRVFDGAQTVMGDSWYCSVFPYHQSAEHIVSFAELCFNFCEYIVPIVDFPNIAQHCDGKKYIVVKIRRTDGRIHQAMIKTDCRSMVIYRMIDNGTFVHPAYIPAGSKLVPIVKTHFNHDGSDLDLNELESDYPQTDCKKDIPVESLIELNGELSDAFSIGDEVLPGFYTAFERSVLNVSSVKLK